MGEKSENVILPRDLKEDFLQPLVELVEAESGHCRWPYFIEETHWCCGRAQVPGKPYCQEHYPRTLAQKGAVEIAELSRPAPISPEGMGL